MSKGQCTPPYYFMTLVGYNPSLTFEDKNEFQYLQGRWAFRES